jgi:hypothetical protein
VVSRRECNIIQQLLSNIQAYGSYCCEQPSLLFAVASEIMIDFSVQRLNKYDFKLNDLEEIMGQDEHHDLPIGNPLDLDFMGTTRIINHVTKMAAVEICILESMLLALERITEWKKELEKPKQSTDENYPEFSATGDTSKSSSVVDEKISFQKDTCHLQLSVAKFQEKRISALTQVVRQSSHYLMQER